MRNEQRLCCRRCCCRRLIGLERICGIIPAETWLRNSAPTRRRLRLALPNCLSQRDLLTVAAAPSKPSVDCRCGRPSEPLLHAPLPTMQLKCVWKFPPTRAVLLGTIDPDSVLCRLSKSDGVLNIILSFVVLYCQGDVSVHRVWRALKRDDTRAGQPD